MRPPTADLSAEDTLRHCPLLEPLSDDQIGALAARASMLSLRAGKVLFRPDDRARHLFVVESGRLAIRLASPSGAAIETEDVREHCLSGWSALVAPFTYLAEARAAEDTTVLVFRAEDVEEVLLQDPVAGYAVMKHIAAAISTRLRDLKEELIEQLAQAS